LPVPFSPFLPVPWTPQSAALPRFAASCRALPRPAALCRVLLRFAASCRALPRFMHPAG